MKKPLKLAGIIVGAFVVLLVIIGSVTGCGGAQPVATATATATATASASASSTRTPGPVRTPAAAAKVKVQPKKTPAPPATYRAPAPPPPPPPPHTTAPAAAPAPPAVTKPAAAKPAGCYPLSNEGTCYEPGEYCRKADHGSSGVAGDGKAITCEDNNGWRWEPS